MNGGPQGVHQGSYPTLTALDRFLSGPTHSDNHHQHNHFQNHGINPFITRNVLSKFGSLSPDKSLHVDQHNRHVFTNTIHECLSLQEVRNQESNLVIVLDKSLPFSRSRKPKGDNISEVLIKGKWSVEEDRKLIRLVNEYGERRWSFIVENMTGREAKQCRDRWSNCLRPYIKKDVWSEEEVKQLINAHQKLGNKWTKIAKLIPGRTERSVKNLWNSTNRRKYSRNEYISPQLILLQDYIDNTCNESNDLDPSASAASSNTISSGASTGNLSTIFPEHRDHNNNDYDTSMGLTHTYEDELNFLKMFFETSTTTPDAGNTDGGGLYGKHNWICDIDHMEEALVVPIPFDHGCQGDVSLANSKTW